MTSVSIIRHGVFKHCIACAASLALAQSVITPRLYAQVPPAPVPVGDSGPDESVAKDNGTEINVKNAEIAAIVKIFSKKTQRNYILDERVKGKVSIYLPGKVSSEESLRILDSVLAFKGFTSVPIGENLWKIVPGKEARQSTIPTIKGDHEENFKPSAAMVTRLLNLKFVTADEMKQLLTQLISPDGLINAYTGTNSLIIIDSEDNIERLIKIVETLDVPFSDREMTIVEIQFADAVDIAAKLNEILGNGSSENSGDTDRARLSTNPNVANRLTNVQLSNPGMPPLPGGPGSIPPPMGGAASTTTVTSRAREPKIIADERTNSIILVADEDTTTRIRALISQLDSKLDLSGNRFYVYRCQHANAQELAETLGGLVGGGSSSSGSSGPKNNLNNDTLGINDNTSGLGGNSRNSRNSNNSRSSRSQSRLSGQSRKPGESRSDKTNNKGSGGTVNLNEDISITADASTNSLIISASKTDYQKILQLLEKLDIKRRQVLVEAMLLEVGVDESNAMGFDFLTSTGGKDGGILAKSDTDGQLTTLLSDPTKLSNFSIAAASSGSLTLPGNITIPTQTMLLTAAKTNSNVNVLSAPTILATDNEQAEIVVGQNVPFIASTATSDTNLNNTFNQIDRQDVGITLRLTPQISSGESVKLSIFTEVSNVIAVTPQLGPTTTIRTSETTVIAKDGQMIVIGGLMSDDISGSDSGVPYLKDVPILGHLFKGTADKRKRTNLLIFITPRVIKDQFDSRDTTIAQRQRMEDVIASNEVYPNRREVLDSLDIDRVASATKYEGPKPGTITASKEPRKLKSLAAENQSASKEHNITVVPPVAQTEENSAVDSESSGDGDSIELRVAPKLPESSQTKSKGSKNAKEVGPRHKDIRLVPPETLGAEPRARLNPASTEGSASTGAYVVLDLGKVTTLPDSLPFKVFPKQRYVGIMLPGQTESNVRRFFRAGSSYQYDSEQARNMTLTAVGIFSSEEEARTQYEGIPQQWYILSPYEIMNLGTGPWQATRD